MYLKKVTKLQLMLYHNQLELEIHTMISQLIQLTELNNLDYCLRNCTKEESEQNNLLFVFVKSLIKKKKTKQKMRNRKLN